MQNILNARYGDEGKLWHLGATLIVGAVMWVLIIEATISIVNMILDY